MAGHPPPEGVGDDFLEQILSMPLYGGGSAGGGVERNLADLVLHQGSRQGGHVSSSSALGGAGFPFLGGGVFQMDRRTVEGGGSGGSEEFLDAAARGASPAKAVCDGQGPPESLSVEPHSTVPRPRARAKRGQSTNPHSIAERLRRERIAERMRALQELVPSCNKTDRAAMVDEIVDYVKFLRLQVKVLSMSRLGGAGASAEADIPVMPLQGEASEDESNQQVWERWSTGDSTEQQVAKLMEEDVGAAMQFLQSNALCIVPISLAASICNLHDQPGTPSAVKPDPGAPS